MMYILDASVALKWVLTELSSQARIGVYDCLYVALAAREGCEVVTADDRLVKSLPGFPIVPLSSL